MFWQEDRPEREVAIPDDIIDVQFALSGKRIPVDHAHALAAAIAGSLPPEVAAAELGVHSVHVAGSQNGWERPAHDGHHHLMLSRRTKLTIRAPKQQAAALKQALTGQTLSVGGCQLNIGAAKERLLSGETTLFARHVVDPFQANDEERFLEWAVGELRALDIAVRKALCGKTTRLATPDGALLTRSLLLAELSVSDSLALQRRGIGTGRQMGCGIFIAHKGIDAVQPEGR